MRYVGGHVIRGQLARGETSPGRAQRTLDPVDPERPPVAAIDVPGQEVPAARGVHQAIRLDVASADASSPGVLQAQPTLIPAGRRDRGQPLGVHLVRPGTRPGQRDRGGVEGGDPVPEPGRQRLLELGQRTKRALFQPGHAAGRSRVHADRHRHRLTDPAAHGGDSDDAFHVVIPSLPGYGFSGPLTQAGWTDGRTAAALAELMARLGYRRYGIQGGDVGAFIAPLIGRAVPDRVIGVHLNALVTFPTGDPADMAAMTAADRGRLAAMKEWQQRSGAYMQVQGTRPQTIAHSLTDSPVGLLAWIVEKFQEWTDPAAALPEDAVDRDRILTDVSIYWFTGTAGSAAHTYYERFNDPAMWTPLERSTVPTVVSVFTTDVTVRPFAAKFHNVVRWSEFTRGGHFAALEAPTSSPPTCASSSAAWSREPG